MTTLSQHAKAALLSARRSTKGAVVFDFTPAAERELRDNGLVNSHYKLTDRGARERELLTTAPYGGDRS